MSLLDFLETSIGIVTGNCRGVFCDLFAGTGAVGSHFKKKGYKIIANDNQYYSYVLNRHYIGNHKELTFSRLGKEISALKNIKKENRKEAVCKYLSTLKGTRGFIYNNYCFGGTKNKKESRQYFSDENGMRCDAVRQKIEIWKRKRFITMNEYYFLVASLLESIDKYANTASVYGAFLKKLKSSATRPFVLQPAKLIINDQNHNVFNKDINVLIEKISGDILYLDPPYNQRQYATNYHLLETIAKYDHPKVFGKTGLREYVAQKSKFCSRKEVKTAFRDIISKAKTKYIFLSYNNEGLMTPNDIKEIMSIRGKYGYFTKSHTRFKADASSKRNYRAEKTVEYLHYVICV